MALGEPKAFGDLLDARARLAVFKPAGGHSSTVAYHALGADFKERSG